MVITKINRTDYLNRLSRAVLEYIIIRLYCIVVLFFSYYLGLLGFQKDIIN